MRTIHWGIIGLGNIATKFAHAIQSVPDAKLSAVASRSKEKSESFGQPFGLKREQCYGNYDALVNDETIDAIYIALPNHLHKLWSIKALNAKKAVLCEKPSTLNADELEAVLACANLNQVFYMEAMKTRFLPATYKAKELLSTIGTPQLVYGDFGYTSSFDISHNLYNKEAGGGALLDVGVYPLAFTLDLFTHDYKHFSSTQTIGEHGVDINTSILIQTSDGLHCHLFASIVSDSPRDYLIVGEKGSIRIPRFSNAQSLIHTLNGKETHYSFKHLVNGLEYQIMEVNQCLNQNRIQSEIMSWNDSRVLMRIVDSIMEQ